MNTSLQDPVDRVRQTLAAVSSERAMGRFDRSAAACLEAEQLLRALIESDPDDPSHTQTLGSTLYTAGEMQLISGDAGGAVKSLQRAEAAYNALRQFDWPAAELAPLVADVRVRRARALVASGHAASALVDAQAAVLAYTSAWSGTPHDPLALDVARVLSWNAWVMAMEGDPDVAVAAADGALRIYVARTEDIHRDAAMRARHVPTLTLAAGLATVIHRARGRPALADQAAQLAGGTTPRIARLPSMEAVSAALTLAEALTVANARELRAELVAPVTDCRIRVPLERVPAQRAPLKAASLAQVGARIVDENPLAALRIALEAHAMFAGASELGGSAMGCDLLEWVPQWIALLHRAGQASEALGRSELARDFSDWIGGRVAQLMPFTPILAEPVRASVRRALGWQERFLSSIGDSAGAQSCGAVLSSLDGVYTIAGASPAAHDTASSWSALDEATQLNQAAANLYREGRFQEALLLAERSLTLQEQVLGSMHPMIAIRLNNVAVLHQEQGAHAAAEPLLVRALDIAEQALGAMHPTVATNLNNLAELYRAQGAYGKAEPLLVRALDIAEQALGPMHSDVATNLNNLALIYWMQGAYGKAEPLLVRALDIAEQALGPTHRDVAGSLSNLAGLYLAQASYDRAEPLLVRALDVAEQVLGPTHPDLVVSLSNLARLYQAQAAYDRAEPLLVRALDIAEQALGPRHPTVAVVLSNLAGIYQVQEAHDRAEALYLRALDGVEQALGPTHPDVAVILNNLARLHVVREAYGKAEPLLVRALDIAEQALGPMHRTVAASLSNLASIYQGQGAHGKAEPLFIRALQITERALGPMHPDVAVSLNNLAGIYLDQGAHGKAEPLLTRALHIKKTALGDMHPDVVASLNDLAALLRKQGAYSEAESLLVRALDITERSLGPMHPSVADSLSKLAGIYRMQGQHGKAEALLVRTLDISERTWGPVHSNVAASLNNLAILHVFQGAYDEAERCILRALDIIERSLGPMHPSMTTGLNNLAVMYWKQGAHDKVEPLLARAAEVRERQLHAGLAHLSESRKRELMAVLRPETDCIVSLHAGTMPHSARTLELAFTTILQRKGRIIDSVVDGEAALRAGLTPALREQLDELSRVRAELSAQLYTPMGPRDEPRAEAISAARARIDDLESALGAASAEFRAQAAPVTMARIQAALPESAVLVEFVRYQHFDPRRVLLWREERYVAYLLTPHGPPQWVALGAADSIDAEVGIMLAAMHGEIPRETTNAALQRLDTVVFAPIRARLTGVSHVILAPDSRLNLVPFEALVDSRGHHALENYLVSYVTTGRDLLRFPVPRTPRSPPVIVAGPDYGPLPSARVPGAMAFAPLTGALAEATDLQEYFLTAPLTGGKATKAALAAMTGPAMLHVATHGFFAQDLGALPARARHRARDVVIDSDELRLLPLHPDDPDDPIDSLDRAGLAMAGANQGADGILTARELAGFDWSGTQLVVLSACETGVGAVPSGDGVYGMRRALVLAGTASQVVSLWSVSDSSTPELMRDYYRELMQNTGRAEALRRAKLRMMSRRGHAHPYYWAAFIPAGDWRPLRANIRGGLP